MMVKVLSRLMSIMLSAVLLLGICILPGCSLKVEQLDDNNDAVNGQTDDTEDDADGTEPSQLLNFRSSVNTEALSRFGFTLLQSMAKESDDSVLISPLSVSVCLAMIANGAEGESRDLLLSTISGSQSIEESNAFYGEMLSAYDELGGSTDYSLANCACVDPFGKISESFIETCESTFDAEVIDMPLSTEEAMKTINQWVSKKTDGKIPGILDKPLSDDCVLELLGALSMDMKWLELFDKDKTDAMPFTHDSGEVENMDFLVKSGSDGGYTPIISDGVNGVIVSYDDSRLGFVALLPDEDLNTWLAKMTPESFNAILSDVEFEHFSMLAFPKIEMDWNTNLNETLESMGLGSLFDRNQANFSSLGDARYFLEEVVQAGNISVTEEGTHVRVSSGISTGGAGASMGSTLSLIFDRPFLYGIIDTETHVPFLLGTFE